MSAIIRNMNLKDIKTIVELDDIIFGESLGEQFLESELLENPMAGFFIMEEDQKIIGFISFWIDEKKAQINNFYIIPKEQKKGHGKELLNHMMKYFDSKNVKEVTLEVKPSNKNAIELYQRYGFKEVAVRRNYYSNGEDAFLMYTRIGSE